MRVNDLSFCVIQELNSYTYMVNGDEVTWRKGSAFLLTMRDPISKPKFNRNWSVYSHNTLGPKKTWEGFESCQKGKRNKTECCTHMAC
jgi:hypothetical protein